MTVPRRRIPLTGVLSSIPETELVVDTEITTIGELIRVDIYDYKKTYVGTSYFKMDGTLVSQSLLATGGLSSTFINEVRRALRREGWLFS